MVRQAHINKNSVFNLSSVVEAKIKCRPFQNYFNLLIMDGYAK